MGIGGNSGGSSGGIKAGRAFVELYVKNTIVAGLNSAARQFKSFGHSITNAGKKIAIGGISAGSGIGAIFTASVKRSAEIGALSLKFNESAENLSALGYAAGQASLDMAELMGGFDKMPKAIVEAQDAASGMAKTFETLGLDAEEILGMGKLDQFLEISEALKESGLSDDEKYTVTKSILGKAGGQFTEFLSGGADEIRKGMQEAAEVGAVVSQEQADNAKRIEDAFSKAWTAAKNAVLSFGDALLPQAGNIDKIVSGITEVTAVVREWVDANREIVMGLGLAVAGATAVGIGMIVLGPAIAAIGAGWSLLTGIVSGSFAVFAAIKAIIFAPILAIPVALALAGAAWLAFTDSGRAAAQGIADGFMAIFGPTIENMKESFKGVVSAVGRGDLKLAFSIGVGAMKVEWARLTVWLTDYWNKFKGLFLDGWRDLALGFTNIWASAVHGTADLLTNLAETTGIYTEKEAADIKKIMDEDAIRDKKDRINNRIRQQVDSDKARAGNLAAAGGDLVALEAAQKQLLLVNAFRQAFSGMKGVGVDPKKDDAITNSLNKLEIQSRGTWGGSASAGFFGGSDGVGEAIKKGIDKTNELLEKQNRILSPREMARVEGFI